MNRFFLIGAGAFTAMTGAALASDSAKISRDIDLRGFDRIEVSGVYELEVKVGSEFSISLSGDREELDRVEASVKDGVLVLAQEERKRKLGWRGKDHDSVEAVISMPSLTGLDVTGVVDGGIRGIDADRFEISISGVGDVDLSGACGALDAQVAGVGELNAKELKCASVDIVVSGVGEASVFASDAVDARVSGMGDIDVYGSPKNVSKNDSLFAEVTVH